MKRYVIVAGNIGVGKSSLVERLCARLGWQPFYEAVTENPYLADFYSDMLRWGFHSQIFFLANRLHIHRQIADHPTSVIQDRSVYEDAEVFARNLFLQGHFSERDYATYRNLYQSVMEFLPPPDVIVYLRASVRTLLDRIGRRGRDFETTIAPEYLAQLNELYEQWIADFRVCPALVVSADEMDFVANPGHLDLIAEQVLHQLEIAR